MKVSNYIEIYHFTLFVFIILYSIGIFYLKKGFRKKYPRSSTSLPSVSIIVCMHNEEKNAFDCLDKLVAQDYPENELEIIIVNDRSTDNTGDIITEYCKNNSFIQQITIRELNNDFAPKKYAIDQALKTARGDIILLTDADGRPTSHWVKQISSSFTEGVGMVIGYAPYESDSNQPSFWNRLLSLEYLSHAAVAASSCGIGYPVTCVGTNMAYRKIVYEQLDGFGIYKTLHTGDDDLFLQRVRDESDWEIVYISGNKSHVYNAAPTHWEKFYQQRIRYASKGFKYPMHITSLLILFYMINLFLFLAPITFIYHTNSIFIFLVSILIKAFCDFIFLKSASLLLEDTRNLKMFPVAFILHIPYVVFFGLITQVKAFDGVIINPENKIFNYRATSPEIRVFDMPRSYERIFLTYLTIL